MWYFTIMGQCKCQFILCEYRKCFTIWRPGRSGARGEVKWFSENLIQYFFHSKLRWELGNKSDKGFNFEDTILPKNSTIGSTMMILPRILSSQNSVAVCDRWKLLFTDQRRSTGYTSTSRLARRRLICALATRRSLKISSERLEFQQFPILECLHGTRAEMNMSKTIILYVHEGCLLATYSIRLP